MANNGSEQIIKALKEETQETIQSLCTDWADRASLIARQLNALTMMQVNQENASRQVRFLTRKERVSAEDWRQQEIAETKASGYTMVAKQAYRLLHEVGEKVRGEEIIYHITFYGDGSQGTTNTTFAMKLSTFLDVAISVQNNEIRAFATAQSRRDRFMRRLQKQVELGNVEEYDWSREKQEAFEQFAERVEEIRLQQGRKRNTRGNILEAFYHYQREKGIAADDFRNDDSSFYKDMIKKMENDANFEKIISQAWNSTSGLLQGDVDNVQIKGEGFSVISVNQLLTQMQLLAQNLKNVTTQALDSKKGDISSKADDTIQKVFENAVEKLLSQFSV